VVYSLAEVRAILAHTDERNLAFVVLGLFAGIRPFELYRLPWADVNLDQGRAMIRRDVSKTKKPSPHISYILSKLGVENG